MHVTIKFLTVVIIFTNFYQLRLLVSGKSDMELFKENTQRNKMFKCGPPQPRVIKWENILTDKEKPNACEVIHPHVAVLHKCDFEAGCCSSSDRSCKPERTETVELVFQITRIDHKGYSSCPNSNNASSIRHVRVEHVNHTVCACHTNLNTPK